jgi:hypothetical protein
LVQDHGFTRIAFADIMRECALALDPVVIVAGKPRNLTWVVEVFGWDAAKSTVPDVRRTLQRLGTEVGRSILGEDVWVNATMAGLDPDGSYAIADCRFQNEAIAVVQDGGVVWRITRPGCGPVNDHPSETGLDDWPFDAILKNDSTLDHLREVVGLALDAAGIHPLAHV